MSHNPLPGLDERSSSTRNVGVYTAQNLARDLNRQSKRFAVLCFGFHETNWALYAQEGQKTVPTGSKCEKCYKFHATCFKVTCWPVFVDEYWKNESFQRIVNDAKAKYEQGSGDGRETVASETSVTLEVERCFVLATERDLRKMSGLARIPKSMTKGVPQLVLPADKTQKSGDDETEIHYVFADAENPLKRARVKSSLETSLIKSQLLPTEVYRDGQAREYMQHYQQAQHQDCGLEDLLMKEACGRLSLSTLEEFIGRDKSACLVDVDADGGNDCEQSSGSASGPALVGVAARDIDAAAGIPKRLLVTPQGKSTTGGLARASSTVSGPSNTSSPAVQLSTVVAAASTDQERLNSGMSSRVSEADGGLNDSVYSQC
eukprot:5838260-Amphidinium_carterae.2